MNTFQLVGFSVLAIAFTGSVLAAHDEECQAEWRKSSAYSTCSGNNWTTASGVNPSGYAETKPGDQQPVKFCKLSQTCMGVGYKEEETGLATGHTQIVGNRTAGDYTFRLNELSKVNNCNGTITLNRC